MNSELKDIENNLKTMSLSEKISFNKSLTALSAILATLGVMSILLVLFFTNIVTIVLSYISLYILGNMSVASDQIKTLVADSLKIKSTR